MSTASSPPPPDECYRCGYDLRGIDNTSPCPECGLLAERSRRPSDELHDTRPRWLRRLSWGVWLILLAIPVIIAGRTFAKFIYDWWMQHQPPWGLGISFWTWLQFLSLLGPELGFLIVWIGALLLTSGEGYPPADRADASLRRTIRWVGFTPLLAIIVYQLQLSIDLRLGAQALIGSRWILSHWLFS